MLGSENLTATPDEQKLTEPGMAHWAGSGPIGKFCKDCKFKGYYRQGRDKFDPATEKYYTPSYRTGGCAKYHDLTGQPGPEIKGMLRACKYFEPKDRANGR